MNVVPPVEIVLPDPDQLRARINYHVAEANTLRRLLRLVNRLKQEGAGAATPAGPGQRQGGVHGR